MYLHKSPLDLPVRAGPLRKSSSADRVDLIHEYDAGFVLARIGEHFADESGGFADVFVNNLAPGQGKCYLVERLGRTAEETTLRKLVLRVAATALASRVFPGPNFIRPLNRL